MKLHRSQGGCHGDYYPEHRHHRGTRCSSRGIEERSDSCSDPQTGETGDPARRSPMQRNPGQCRGHPMTVTALSCRYVVRPALQREAKALRERAEGREQRIRKLCHEEVPVMTEVCVSMFMCHHDVASLLVEHLHEPVRQDDLTARTGQGEGERFGIVDDVRGTGSILAEAAVLSNDAQRTGHTDR